MVSDRHRQVLLLQLGLILVNCVALAWLITTPDIYTPILLCLIALGIQITILFRYLDRTNRAVARFLTTVRHRDFSQNFTDDTAPVSFRELGEAMEEVIKSLRRATTEKEEQARYLEVLVRHIPVAVIALDEQGTVSLFNNAARRLLGLGSLRSIHELREFDESLSEALVAVAPGEERLQKISTAHTSLHLSISATSLKLGGSQVKIIAIQDIRESLESTESEAWQNLIRVLNHEIMNSMTPITSLAVTGKENTENVMSELGQDSPVFDALEDVRDALEVMGKRGKGLMRFVDSYRSLASLPQVKMNPFGLGAFIDRIHQLMTPEFNSAGIDWQCKTSPPGQEMSGDAELLEQAVINLLKNARDAVSGQSHPAISITAELGEKGKVIISVTDNGVGMDEETRKNIFVPFFTTKRDGTGVGMSLVHRIVRLQGGQVHVKSSPGQGSTIELVF
jgi:nitrogen fixation/metabolism regulation signal transduction histidine kinase